MEPARGRGAALLSERIGPGLVSAFGGLMQHGASVNKTTTPSERAETGWGGISLLWPALAALSIAIALGAIVLRAIAGARFEPFLVFAAGFACIVLALRLLVRDTPSSESATDATSEPMRELLEGAGPGVASISLDGRLTYVNPSAERMLGYHAEDLVKSWSSFSILGPGEGSRMVAEMQRLCDIEPGCALHFRRAPEDVHGVCTQSSAQSHTEL